MASKLAVQMYTIRDHTGTAKELAESFRKIADIGYPAVQLSAVGAMNGDAPEVSASDCKKMLDDHGLTCVATHRPWNALMNETDSEIDFHKTIDCDFAAIGGIPPEYGHTAEGYRRFLADAKPVIAKLKAAGIKFGHHNHSHEFVRVERHGMTLEDILIEEGGPDLMMELDLYWVQNAGVYPVRIIERCRGRVPFIHLKDKEVVVDEGPVMAPIGEGNLDWDHIIPACEDAGVEWYGIEQDTCRRDPFDCLKASFDFLTGKGL
ncbi:MAG: sugar phosphate isomerase/epimerase [Candidatus Pacebacteria bacterium]|nr:sugar phosphate isomerase/epimerase [Candidatus Paceibacterota bacterium]